MNIGWEQVEAIIRDEARSRAAGPTGTCPAPDDLVRLVEGKTGRKAKARTLEHVAGCPDCAKIVQSLLRLSREVDRLIATPEAVRGRAPIPGRRLAFVGLASLAGLAVMTALAIRLLERPAVRSATGAEIRLIEPKKGGAIAARDLKFSWQAVPQASHYHVDLFGPELEKIMSSAPVPGPSFEPPAEAFRALVAGQRYFWRVRAVMEEGREVVSKLSEFSILE